MIFADLWWSGMILTVFLKPGFFDQTAITNDADARKQQLLFAVSDQLAQKRASLMKKGLST